ncbi:phage tail protein [Anaeroselena agilis]|uniref:Phage tail protein n=1 Tax=Anaeroselena agilis TaxID=3063788 RepID=A0ABU3NX50_9FIRM|nr:phage tail protein [Selenomonadales bacterium 4137-cl]
MQQFVNIQSTETLTNSRQEILNNDFTIMSCNSGTSFPTTNLQVGMLCFRTDLNQIFELKDLTPTWVLIADLTKTYTNKEYVDAQAAARLALSGGTMTGNMYFDVTGAEKDIIFSVSGANKWGIYGNNGGIGLYDWLNNRNVLQYNPVNNSLNTVSALQVSGNTVWHAGNMGTGSGLNADTLQGLNPTNFLTAGVPIGGIIPWTTSASIPTGYLECNGQALSRTVYSELFAVIGTNYGAGDGSTTFNLPDLRGEFLRGFDNNRGIDAGRAMGSWQADLFKSHNHIMPWGETKNVTTPPWGWAAGYDGDNQRGSGSTDANNSWYYTSSTGGAETRPRNVALMFIIKVKNVVGSDPAVLNGNANYLGGVAADGYALANHTHPTGVVTILTGTIAHGGTIPLPTGYTQAQCAWIVSPYNFNTAAFDVNEGGTWPGFTFQCYADPTTRVVTATHGFNVQSAQACTAYYMIIGVK